MQKYTVHVQIIQECDVLRTNKTMLQRRVGGGARYRGSYNGVGWGMGPGIGV